MLLPFHAALAQWSCLTILSYLMYSHRDELENELNPSLQQISVLEIIQFGVQIAFQLDSQLQLLERDELHSIQDSRSILHRSLLKVTFTLALSISP